jgi:hypothetical protein
MKSIMFPRFHCKETIETLQYFIKELEHGNKDLTKKQTKTLTKVAKGLVSSLETELSGELRIKSGVAN